MDKCVQSVVNYLLDTDTMCENMLSCTKCELLGGGGGGVRIPCTRQWINSAGRISSRISDFGGEHFAGKNVTWTFPLGDATEQKTGHNPSRDFTTH